MRMPIKVPDFPADEDDQTPQQVLPDPWDVVWSALDLSDPLYPKRIVARISSEYSGRRLQRHQGGNAQHQRNHARH